MTNLPEACPEVMTPMCAALWGDPAEWAWLYSMYQFGVIPHSEVVVSPDVNDRGVAYFYGRQAFNVVVIRLTMASLPGVDPDDFERDLMGSVRPDDAPIAPKSDARLPHILVKGPVAALRTGKRIRALYDELTET